MSNDSTSACSVSTYAGTEARKAFEKANDTAIDRIIEILREKNMTLREAQYLLGLVEDRISKEARI